MCLHLIGLKFEELLVLLLLVQSFDISVKLFGIRRNLIFHKEFFEWRVSLNLKLHVIHLDFLFMIY